MNRNDLYTVFLNKHSLASGLHSYLASLQSNCYTIIELRMMIVQINLMYSACSILQ